MNAANSHIPAKTPDEAKPELRPEGLTLGETELHFKAVAPGEEGFRILRITPPHPGVVVTLTVEPSDQFQVAAGVEQLHFVASLTFVPHPTGTYVHLRYKPQRAGRHQAQLLVQTINEEKDVELSGRTTGLAALLPSRRVRQSAPRQWSFPAWGVRLANGFLVLAALGLMGWYGYGERCRFFPGLCESAPALAPPIAEPAKKAAPVVITTRPPEPTRIIQETPPERSATPKAIQPAPPEPVQDQTPLAISEKVSTRTAAKTSEEPRTPAARRSSPPKPMRATPKADDISDLERVLNRDTTH